MEQTNKRKFTVGYHHGKLNVLLSYYKFPPMTFSQLIVNWLLGIVSENVPFLWTLSSKGINNVKNGKRMWNMMKCFMSEVKRVAIDKVCWKAKVKYWDYMSAINIWDNVKNDFNIKYMANNKRENSCKKVYNSMSSSNIFQDQNNTLKIHH